MKTVDIRHAKAHLFKFVEEAFKGKPFVITKGGMPMVKVAALRAPVRTKVKRLGFMAQQISVPDDFDRMGAKEIERLLTAGK